MKKTLRIALVSCVSKKLAAPAKAADLYTSDLFRKSRTYAERNADRWLILSAAHGVVAPTTELAPYDVTLSKMKAAEVRAWGAKVAAQLEVEVARLAAEAGVELSDVELVILAGESYSAFRAAFEKRLPAVRVSAPLAGLGIGQRLAHLKRENEAVAANPVVAAREATTAARDAFDAACYCRATLHLASGYGVDREADKRAAVAATEAIEAARLAFRAAHAVYATELRRSMGLEPVGVEATRVEQEAADAAEALPTPVAPITPEIERAAFASIRPELDRLGQLEDGDADLEARHLELRGRPNPIGSRSALFGSIALALTRRAALALVSRGPADRLAELREELSRAHARRTAILDQLAARASAELPPEAASAHADVTRLGREINRLWSIFYAPPPRVAAQLAVARARYVEPSPNAIARAERALGA